MAGETESENTAAQPRPQHHHHFALHLAFGLDLLAPDPHDTGRTECRIRRGAAEHELHAAVPFPNVIEGACHDHAAVVRVDAADQQAQRLSAASESMGGIVELIGNITGQINLLALNATIESARAGEAGRGFAVVASEVKNLANQAKQATDKIGQEIGNLNGISADVVSALTAIKQSIQEVSEYVTSTAAAVEEQSTVTSEMSTSMQRAAAEAAGAGR